MEDQEGRLRTEGRLEQEVQKRRVVGLTGKTEGGEHVEQAEDEQASVKKN